MLDRAGIQIENCRQIPEQLQHLLEKQWQKDFFKSDKVRNTAFFNAAREKGTHQWPCALWLRILH
jgi:hypothetical protein